MITPILDLASLNPSQYEAATFKDGVAQIISVAGSGKTRVLTYRVANMILNEKINPKNILVTTFSRKAAEEMEGRLFKLISKEQIKNLTIGTFHSIAYHILAKEYKLLNLPMQEAFKWGNTLNDVESKAIIESCMKETENEFGTINSGEILRVIGMAKNELINPQKFMTQAVLNDEFLIGKIYDLYEKKKFELKKIDFDDMLLKLYELFHRFPSTLRKYQNQFKYLLIDEAQDNNYAQYILARMIGEPHNNIMIVGDDDQSLYGFRGARPKEFINFTNYYPNAKIIKLETNYRSRQQILEVANKIISNNEVRLDKTMIAHNLTTTQEDVTFNIYGNEDDEAQNVIAKIKEYQKKDMKLKDCAVLFRTNSQTRALEDSFIKNDIPYIIYGGVSFYERPEIKDLVSYVKLIIDKDDNRSLERIINVPYRYISKEFLMNLKSESKKRKLSLYESLKWVSTKPSQHRNIMKFMEVIDKAVCQIQNGTLLKPFDLIQWIINETKYTEYIKEQGEKKNKNPEDDNDPLENIQTLLTAASRFQTIDEFLDSVQKAKDMSKNKIDAVQVMTIHKSKGLEFKVVFLIGLCENILPHRYAVESLDPTLIEEERRLAYVATTRAKENAHFSTMTNYNRKEVTMSRFLTESDLVNE